MPALTKPINKFTTEQQVSTNIATTSAYGVENGHSVKIPIPKIREGLATDEALRKQGEDFTSDQQRQDKALADYKIVVTSDQQRQDKALSDFKKEYTEKQTEQDGKITEVERSISTAKYVPYSSDLDAIEDDKGLIWQVQQNTNPKYTDGYFYKNKQETIVVSEPGYYVAIEEGLSVPSGIYKKSETNKKYPITFMIAQRKGYEEYSNVSMYKVGVESTSDLVGGFAIEGNDVSSIVEYDDTTGYVLLSNGHEYNTKSKFNVGGRNFPYYNEWTNTQNGELIFGYCSSDSALFVNMESDYNSLSTIQEHQDTFFCYEEYKYYRKGETIILNTWKQTNVQPTSESEIKTDLTALTNRVGTAETAISNINAKWSEVLYSQIDADHTTLETLSSYLTSAKRTSIDNAISLAHAQNTDTQLKDGVLFVNEKTSNINITNGLYVEGDVVSGLQGMHHLREKLNSSMQRTYATTEDLIADMANIPEGAWCAIIDTHSAGVSAQSDDDIIE